MKNDDLPTGELEVLDRLEEEQAADLEAHETQIEEALVVLEARVRAARLAGA